MARREDPSLLNREETIRSKSREGVEQELWGLLLTYNLVRLAMERVAESAKVEPTRIRLVESLPLVHDRKRPPVDPTE